jgi:hypothetical protein
LKSNPVCGPLPENAEELLKLKQPLNVPVSGNLYRLVEEYRYYFEKNGVISCIIVPKGFTYDGASSPRISWTMSGIIPDGLIRPAALVHDWIYNFDGDLPLGSHTFYTKGVWVSVITRWSRKDADRIFLKIMRQAGMDEFQSWLAYYAVRAFGWTKWK